MKYIKNKELFERKIVRKPTPIGDFIVDKFFNVNDAYITEYEPTQYRQYYVILITFKYGKSNLTLEDFDILRNFILYMDKFCYSKPKHGITFRLFDYNTIEISLKILPSKIEEIKKLPEYDTWWQDIQDKYGKVKDERRLRKYAKKYNL